jgi:hypothetical protein
MSDSFITVFIENQRKGDFFLLGCPIVSLAIQLMGIVAILFNIIGDIRLCAVIIKLPLYK